MAVCTVYLAKPLKAGKLDLFSTISGVALDVSGNIESDATDEYKNGYGSHPIPLQARTHGALA